MDIWLFGLILQFKFYNFVSLCLFQRSCSQLCNANTNLQMEGDIALKVRMKNANRNAVNILKNIFVSALWLKLKSQN